MMTTNNEATSTAPEVDRKSPGYDRARPPAISRPTIRTGAALVSAHFRGSVPLSV
ncbi:MAG: hypothetical protein MUC62_04170 [Candidatus Thermoplasmatota archaeon]|nr:hypothetical protein [Candidatus Thermoplasmatota archaeon]